MTPSVTFVVLGAPKGQPRARAFAFKGKARMYDPGTAEAWKSSVALAAREHLPASPWDVPVKASMLFRFPRPRSHYGKRKGTPYLRPGAPSHVTSKPDADNLAKAVLDALTALRWWRDDAQVAVLRVSKQYADEGGWVGCEVTLSEAGR